MVSSWLSWAEGTNLIVICSSDPEKQVEQTITITKQKSHCFVSIFLFLHPPFIVVYQTLGYSAQKSHTCCGIRYHDGSFVTAFNHMGWFWGLNSQYHMCQPGDLPLNYMTQHLSYFQHSLHRLIYSQQFNLFLFLPILFAIVSHDM